MTKRTKKEQGVQTLQVAYLRAREVARVARMARADAIAQAEEAERALQDAHHALCAGLTEQYFTDEADRGREVSWPDTPDYDGR